MLENIKKIDKKILMMMGVVIGIILLIVIATILVALTGSKGLSYSKIESKMVSAAEEYYDDNSNSLPLEIGKTVDVDVSTLVNGNYLKDLSKYTKDGITCSGKVIVGKTINGYDYVADLDCGDAYKTEFLSDKLIGDVVTTGNGLYKMEDVVKKGKTLGTDADGYDLSSNDLMRGYIYRGDNVNNYVKIDKKLYQIVKIDGNKDLTLTIASSRVRGPYDDRYNSSIKDVYGINDYTVSRAYENVKSEYDGLSEDSLIKNKSVSKNVCVGARKASEKATDGSVECSKVMKDQPYSLIPIFDIMNASLSELCTKAMSRDCSNYNYLFDGSTYWTMTPSTSNTYTAYNASEGINENRTSRSATYKYVYYLSNRLIYVSGSGSEEDPYIVK